MEITSAHNRSKIKIAALLTFSAVAILTVLLITGSGYIYGSTLDWNAQDYSIPDYLRRSFYSTLNIFQSFDINTGAGQDIYALAYYGYLSPVILFSYMLPFVSMKTYMICAAVICVIASSYLMFNWLFSKYRLRTAFVCTLIFELASPMIPQSHRHTMFILYMPFLILALTGAEKYVNSGRRLQFVLCTFLTIMCNFFFAVSACVAIGAYTVFMILGENGTASAHGRIRCFLDVVLNECIAVAMAMILLLPTMSLIISERQSTRTSYSLVEMFIPCIAGSDFMFGEKYLLLNAVVLIAAVFVTVRGSRQLKFLGIMFLALACFPIFIMLLNGMMYLDSKVLIPFLPLAILMTGAAAEMVFAERNRLSRRLPLIMSFTVLAAAIYAVPLNLSDSLVPTTDTSVTRSAAAEKLTDMILSSDRGIYRIGNTAVSDDANVIYDTRQMTTTIYSSLENLDYTRFRFSSLYAEDANRNSALNKTTENLLFNTFMGNRYIISDRKSLPGYTLMYSSSGLNAFRNDDAFPISFITYRTISSSGFAGLSEPEKAAALMTCAVTDSSDSLYSGQNDHTTSTKRLGSRDLSMDNSRIYDVLTSGGTLCLKKDTSAYLNINSSSDKLIMISFNVTDLNSRSSGSGLGCSIGSAGRDVRITINGVLNKLTDPTSRYNNGNTGFEYLIPANSSGRYKVDFSAGKYRLTAMHVSVMDESAVRTAAESITRPEKISIGSGSDLITETITARRSGYLVTTIPWSDNLRVLIDGKQVQCCKTDLAFTGVHIAAGRHTVEIKYVNHYRTAGGILSLTAAALSTMILIRDRKRRKS